MQYYFLEPIGIWSGDVKSINRLLKQFSKETVPINKMYLRTLCTQSALYIARDDNGRIIAMATLTCKYIPTGKVAFLDDVVVAKSSRGQGIGRKIVEDMINLAKSWDVSRIDWTSMPSRKIAHALYNSLNAHKKETTHFSIKLK